MEYAGAATAVGVASAASNSPMLESAGVGAEMGVGRFATDA